MTEVPGKIVVFFFLLLFVCFFQFQVTEESNFFLKSFNSFVCLLQRAFKSTKRSGAQGKSSGGSPTSHGAFRGGALQRSWLIHVPSPRWRDACAAPSAGQVQRKNGWNSRSYRMFSSKMRASGVLDPRPSLKLSKEGSIRSWKLSCAPWTTSPLSLLSSSHSPCVTRALWRHGGSTQRHFVGVDTAWRGDYMIKNIYRCVSMSILRTNFVLPT